MDNKPQKNHGNNYINNNDQKEIKPDNFSHYRNINYYREKQNNKNIIESPKVIPNKILLPQNNELYHSYQQNKKEIKDSTQLTLKNKNLNSEKIIYRISQNNEINNNQFLIQNEDLSISAQMPIKPFQFDSNYQINPNQINQDLSLSIQKPIRNFQISNNQFNYQQQSFEDLSFISQKPLPSYENNINAIKNSNKYSNIVNIDNQSSAIQLSFISKKPKKKYKTSSIFQVGANQTPIGFSFIAEKPNKYMNNNNNLNESNGQNLSFISSRQIDGNELNQFPKQEMFLNVPKSKNNLKIMSNVQKNEKNKNYNQSKPKPILQIVSKNNNYNKKLQENLLPQPQINGFSLNSKNKDSNEIIKNNFVYISKSNNEIYNNNQDLSFISNSKETENLFDINGINIINDYKINCSNSGNISPPKDKQLFSISNGLASSQQSANNNKNNGYIMMNLQFCYLSQKPNTYDDKSYYEYTQKMFNCSLPKKKVKIEYYDIQPVTFQIIPFYAEEEFIKKSYEMKLIHAKKEFQNCIAERIYQIQIHPYKMFRVIQMEYIGNHEEKQEDKKENEKDQEKSEDISEKSFSNKGNKKRKRRRKK